MPSTERMPDPFDVFLSSPVVSGNTVIFGSGDQTVYALDAVTGKLKWSFATGDVVHASPAVANGVVYIGSWDRNLYAIDLASGREKWRYVTGNDTTIYNQIGIASSAAVSGGRVFVGGRDGHFHAVDEKTGKLAWTIDNRGGWTIASPACATASSTSRPPTALASRRRCRHRRSQVQHGEQGRELLVTRAGRAGGDLRNLGWLAPCGDAKSGTMVAEFQTDGSKENGPNSPTRRAESRPAAVSRSDSRRDDDRDADDADPRLDPLQPGRGRWRGLLRKHRREPVRCAVIITSSSRAGLD
jgi:hypothetical protein